MKYSLTLILTFWVGVIAAQNLVPNPGFENYLACPRNVDDPLQVADWFVPLGHQGTADHFHSCSQGNAAVPANAMGYQLPHTGMGCVGLICSLTNLGLPGYREYLQVALSQPLVANQSYTNRKFIMMAILASPNQTQDGAALHKPQNLHVYCVKRVTFHFSVGGRLQAFGCVFKRATME